MGDEDGDAAAAASDDPRGVLAPAARRRRPGPCARRSRPSVAAMSMVGETRAAQDSRSAASTKFSSTMPDAEGAGQGAVDAPHDPHAERPADGATGWPAARCRVAISSSGGPRRSRRWAASIIGIGLLSPRPARRVSAQGAVARERAISDGVAHDSFHTRSRTRRARR